MFSQGNGGIQAGHLFRKISLSPDFLIQEAGANPSIARW
jgi:hypothetical protein